MATTDPGPRVIPTIITPGKAGAVSDNILPIECLPADTTVGTTTATLANYPIRGRKLPTT